MRSPGRPAEELSFPIPSPASLKGRSPASWHPGTSPNTPLSSRASPCAPFKAQEAGPGGRRRKSGPRSGPGRCSARRASPSLAAAHLGGLGHASKVPPDLAPHPVAGPGLESPPRCLGSHRYPGSASWTSHGTETRCQARTDLWAR